MSFLDDNAAQDQSLEEIPQPRGCHLDARFGPAFQAEYDRAYRALERGLDASRQEEAMWDQIHDVGGGALSAILGPFGPLMAEVHKYGHGGTLQADRIEKIRLFTEAIRSLCEQYVDDMRYSAERYRWGIVQLKHGQASAPNWAAWQAMTEPERLRWLPLETEPLTSLRARLVEREDRANKAKKMLQPVGGWLVTTEGRIVSGQFHLMP